MLRWLAILLLGACGGEKASAPDAAATPDGPCLAPLDITVRGPDGRFVPLESAAEGELVLGFQGFRYVYLRFSALEARGLVEADVVATLDGVAPLSQRVRTTLAPAGDRHTSDPAAVFFNDQPLPLLIGRTCALSVRLGGACPQRAEGRFTLRQDPSCYEDAQGRRVCGDGGVPPLPDGGGPRDGGP